MIPRRLSVCQSVSAASIEIHCNARSVSGAWGGNSPRSVRRTVDPLLELLQLALHLLATSTSRDASEDKNSSECPSSRTLTAARDPWFQMKKAARPSRLRRFSREISGTDYMPSSIPCDCELRGAREWERKTQKGNLIVRRKLHLCLPVTTRHVCSLACLFSTSSSLQNP